MEQEEDHEIVDTTHADEEHDDEHGHHERSTKAIVAEIVLQFIFFLFLLLTYRTFKKNK